MSTKRTLYPLVMALFAVILVLSNTTAVKLTVLGPMVATSAIVLFPLAYILGDVITEVYGYAGARRIFWVGLAANLLMAITYTVTILLPGINPEYDEMYAQVLGQVPRIVVASMIGLWAGQFTNAYIMSRLKIVTEGKALWLRTISSTLAGELVDTMLFAILGFAFTMPWSVIGTMIWTCALFKSAYEVLVTPVTYIVVGWFKKVEGEVYDYEVNYSPFTGEA